MTYYIIWIISCLAIAGVIIRPFRLPEAIWVVAGSALFVIFGLLSPMECWSGIKSGTDVYLFLTGMMVLAETAREEKVFDWLASCAISYAKGSSQKLFILMYGMGILVTAFLSNDATAVVLTPAVATAVRIAKIKNPLPYLLICAFIANAASFVLPISNPANLVIYGAHLPDLLTWLKIYTLPSVGAIIVTFITLRFTQKKALSESLTAEIPIQPLTPGGKTAITGIALTAIILLAFSTINLPLGLPTAITGILTSVVVIARSKKNPWMVIKGVSWSVLPLVAGLFVIVEALNKTGLMQHLSELLQQGITQSINGTAWASGLMVAIGCNLVNNLPAGLITGDIIQSGQVPDIVKSAVLIGIDLGPNLSITGSLATILWLVALRREKLNFSAWAFLKLGAFIMTTALIVALAALWI